MRKSEPAVTAASVLGAVLAIFALAGVQLTAVQQEAVASLVAVIVPLVLSTGVGAYIRSRVSPVDPSRSNPDSR